MFGQIYSYNCKWYQKHRLTTNIMPPNFDNFQKPFFIVFGSIILFLQLFPKWCFSILQWQHISIPEGFCSTLLDFIFNSCHRLSVVFWVIVLLDDPPSSKPQTLAQCLQLFVKYCTRSSDFFSSNGTEFPVPLNESNPKQDNDPKRKSLCCIAWPRTTFGQNFDFKIRYS